MRPDEPAVEEAERLLRICAACMYCDGVCAVFPAIDGRHDFSLSDIQHLANLCHNCRGCYYVCQYAPPHPFAVNLPRTLAELRLASYAEHARPRAIGSFFAAPLRVGAVVACVAALTVAVALFAIPPEQLFAPPEARRFSQVPAWGAVTAVASAAFVWALVGLLLAGLAFWRTIRPRAPLATLMRSAPPALSDAVTLRNLGGGGPGCHTRDERYSRLRRRFHHVLVAGFVVSVGSHTLPMFGIDWEALRFAGIAGWTTMLAGIAGLLHFERRADREPEFSGEHRLNLVFLSLLSAVAVSSLAELVLRDTAAGGLAAVLRTGIVTGYFLMLPAGKMVHWVHRSLSLLRAAVDRRRPSAGAPTPE